MILPTLRQLQFMTALAEHGSFSRAATVCNVTQPTLSAAIKEIEALLGVTLFEREARGASLTRAGEAAVTRARVILSEAQDMVAAVQEAGKPLCGPFRLGAIPTIAPYVLPGTMTALRKAYRDLKLYLREDQTDRLLDELRARTLDAALIALPWEAPGIETVSLGDDEFVLAAPAAHPLITAPTLSPADLADQDLLLLEDGHCLRDHALSVCNLVTGRDGAEVSATSLQTLVHMVGGGLGVSLVPKLATDAGIAKGTDVAIRAFDPPIIGRSIGIAWRAGSPRAAEARMVGDAVKSVLAGGKKNGRL